MFYVSYFVKFRYQFALFPWADLLATKKIKHGYLAKDSQRVTFIHIQVTFIFGLSREKIQYKNPTMGSIVLTWKSLFLCFSTMLHLIQAMVHPIEIKGKHFYDSVTNKPVCLQNPTRSISSSTLMAVYSMIYTNFQLPIFFVLSFSLKGQIINQEEQVE